MKPDERILLEELKPRLKGKFEKACLESYLEEPTVEAFIRKALKDLQEVIDEAR
jgi:hypothetical protein